MVLADWGATGQNPSKVATSASATPVYFPRLQYQALSNGQAGGPTGFPGLQAPATPTASSAVGQLIIPGSQYAPAAVGQRLRMIASGTVTTFASYTYEVIVQLNTGSVSSVAYTSLADTGTVTSGAAGTFPWVLEAHFSIGSAASAPTAANIAGFYMGAGGTSTASTLVDLTAIPTTAGNAVVMGVSGLVVNVQFGTGHAGNAATLNEFVILGD